MKRYILRIILVLLTIASLLYILPSRQFTYKGKHYIFENLPSLFGDGKQDLNLEIAKLASGFKYEIQSVQQISDRKFWAQEVAADQKTLETRIEGFVGNNYEVRLQKIDNRTVFTIYTQSPLGESVKVLTTKGGDFEVRSAPSSSVSVDGSTPPTTFQKLNLNRSDFGIADIIANNPDTSSGQQTGPTFDVRLPLGFIGPEKIALINDNIPNKITIYSGGRVYDANFLPNSSGVITHLVANNIESVDEAVVLRDFLNTSGYHLNYEGKSVEMVNTKHQKLQLALLMGIALIVALVVNLFAVKNLRMRRFVYILATTAIAFGATKLFGLTLTNGYVLIMMSLVFMAMFNTKYIYYIAIFSTLALIKLLGYMYFLEITWSQIILLALFALCLWFTKRIKVENPKSAIE